MATTFPDDRWREFNELALERPELWAKCYPKMYQGINGGEYYSAKLVGYFLLSVAIKIEQPEVQLYKHFGETSEAVGRRNWRPIASRFFGLVLKSRKHSN